MPTVEIDPDELRELTGRDEKGDDELREDLFALGLEYEGETDDGEFELEFAPDRLDRLSVEGVARSLRYQYGDDRGVYRPNTNDAEWTIEVEPEVPEQRPYVTGAVVRGLDLDESSLDSLIQLQEKLHATMGRQREKGAIGIHDLTMLKGRDAPISEDVPTGEDEPTDSEAPTDSDASTPSEEADDAEADPRDAADPRDDPRDAAADPRDDPGGRPGDGGAGGTGKSVRYTGIGRIDDEFVPLESERSMTPHNVLKAHHIGLEYADIVNSYDAMPAIYDDIGLFSFPPVINGQRTEVTADSRDLFIEMTGTDQWTIDHMLNIVCYALDARGGRVEQVEVAYADDASGEHAGRTLTRPDFSTKTKTVEHDAVESMLGIDLDGEEVVDLLERAGLDATTEDSTSATEDPDASDGSLAYEVEIPPYRVDVLHPVDVVDDVGRAFGFNDLEPRYPDVSTVGGRHERSRLERTARDTLVGLGFEDLLNFHLISRRNNWDRFDVSRGDDVLGGGAAAAIQEPYSLEYQVVRTWALPSIMLVLENNTHRAYPQDLAEVGFVAEQDESEPTKMAERRHVAAALARHDASYDDAKARLQALCRAFDRHLETPPTEHPAFVDGRTAEVVIDGESAGLIGEIHPKVLVEFDLEVPVAAFEFELDALRES